MCCRRPHRSERRLLNIERSSSHGSSMFIRPLYVHCPGSRVSTGACQRADSFEVLGHAADCAKTDHP